MLYHRSRSLRFINLLLVAGMLLSMVSPFVTLPETVSASNESVSAPSESGINTLDSERPVTAFANEDWQEMLIQQAMGTVVIPDSVNMMMEDGAIRMEPLGNGTNVTLPTTGGFVPQAVNPLSDLSSIVSGNGLDVLGKGEDVPTTDLPFGESNNAGFNPNWTAFNPRTLIASIYAPESALSLLKPSEVYASSWVASRSVSSTTTSAIFGGEYNVFLPVITQPQIEPSNEITVYPDKKAVLISTDGLIRVEVPIGAYDELFILRYTPVQELTTWYWSLDAVTLDGESIELNRSAQLYMRLPETRSGKPLMFRYQSESRTVSLAADVVTANVPSFMRGVESTDEFLVTSIYKFGQFTLASLTEEDGSDEADDDFVIDRFCREPSSLGSDFIIGETYVLSTTEEFAPSGRITLNWIEGYDDSGNPIPGSHTYAVVDADYQNQPDEVKLIHEDIGPHDPTRWLTGTLFVLDYGGEGIPPWRHDSLEDIGFNGGTTGCLSGSCEAQAPRVSSVNLWQSGQESGSAMGIATARIAASDNSGEVSVSLKFNGVDQTVYDLGDGTFLAVIKYPINQENSYEITVIDGCGNSATFPKIEAHGTDSGNLGWASCDKCNGSQMSSRDPVNTKNGNFYDRILDLTVTGIGATTLTIERGYNSMDALWRSGSTMQYTNNGGLLEEEQVAGPPQYFGTGWTFPYAVSLNIQSFPPYYDGAQVSYPDGHTANFIADGSGGYSSASAANFDTLTKEGDGYVLQHKNTLEIERFDADGRLLSREDRNGNTITLTYDGEYLSRVENDSGRWIEFAYTDGYITTITAPENRTIKYGYTDELLTSVTDGNGHTTTYGYDDNGQLETTTTPEGHTSLDQVYDDEYRVDWQKIGRAEINDFTYSEDGLITTITDSYNRDTRYIYNEIGQIIEMVDALNFSESYAYNENYNRTDYTDQLGREWHWTYDDSGNRLTEDGPMGWHQEWTYNDLNRVLSQITKIDGTRVRETTFAYDDKGNLTDISNALTNSSHIEYDDRGLPTNIFDFNGNETINSYDPATGDLIETRNGAGDTVGFGYDGLGRMVAMTDGNSNVYGYTYDHADNLTDINGPLGYHVGYRYDDNDNLEIEIDPNGGETTYVYDESEMVTRIENQLDFPTIFEYDDMNKLFRLEDAEGREWRYEYDAVYQQTAVHAPEDTHTLFTYNGVRNVTSVTECASDYDGSNCPDNRVTLYQYNDLGQMETVIENADGSIDNSTADTNVTTHFAYDLVGNILTLTDANGNETAYEYDLLDQLKREEDAEGQVTEYNYDKNGNLIWLKNQRDFITAFGYDGASRLEMLTDADGNIWHYAYDGNGNLVNETEPEDVVTHYDYDALDRVEQLVQNFVDGGDQTADQNVTTRFAYDLAGNVLTVHDPRGEYTTTHEYDAAHRRLLTIDNEDGETEYVYDKVNNLTDLIDGNDHKTSFVYDGLNRQKTITNPELHSVEFIYDRLGNTLSITDARLNTTYFTYDGMNRVVKMVDALEGVWEYSYDAMGNVQCEIDANLHANDCYTYDKVYRVLSVTDAEGHVNRFTYDENGNRLTWTDGNTHVTTYTYDNLDRLQTLTNAKSETTTYRYDPLGNQTYLIEADGIVTRYGYDPLYRLVTVNQNDQPATPKSADVNVDTHYVYDEVGNLLTIIDAELHETHFAYDGMNRMVEEVDADFNVWQYGYDPVGNRTWRIDANQNRTDYTYYPDNQPETISYELDGTAVAYQYDENNNQVEMVDQLGPTTWVYDALNRVTDVNDALGRHLGYGYDAVGNRTSLTYHDGRVVQYSYYDNDWLQSAIDPENNVTSYERDGVGMMITTTNPNETITTATYDDVNRMLTLVNQEVTGAQKTNSAFSYTYNEVGHRTEMVAEYGWRQPDVVTSTYSYDGLRRLIRDADSEGVWTDYTFDRVGNRLTLDTNDDSLSPRPFDEKTVFYSYSDANRLLSLVGNTHPGSPGVKREENVGQAIYAFRHEVAAQRGVHIHEFAADVLLQMADALIADLEGHPTPDEGEVAVAISAIRTQVQSDWDGGLISSDGIANSLLVKLNLGDSANNNGANDEWQTQTYSYDANGNRINTEYPGPQGPRVQGIDYTYDPENRLIVNWDYQENEQGNRVDRAITTMEYDGDGRRLVKTYDPNEGGGGAKRVEYVFDGWDPVSEYNQLNPQYENFYRGDMNRIMTMHHFPSGTAGQMYWYHYDGLGSVTGLTKQHGQSHHNYRYEPYGQIEMPPGNFTDPHNHYTFTGQEWDENMGLYEFYARDYDPVAGVWLTQDIYRGSKQIPLSLHRYQYVHNNPVNLIDQYGYQAIPSPDSQTWSDIDTLDEIDASQGSDGTKLVYVNDENGYIPIYTPEYRKKTGDIYTNLHFLDDPDWNTTTMFYQSYKGLNELDAISACTSGIVDCNIPSNDGEITDKYVMNPSYFSNKHGGTYKSQNIPGVERGSAPGYEALANMILNIGAGINLANQDDMLVLLITQEYVGSRSLSLLPCSSEYPDGLSNNKRAILVGYNQRGQSAFYGGSMHPLVGDTYITLKRYKKSIMFGAFHQDYIEWNINGQTVAGPASVFDKGKADYVPFFRNIDGYTP